MKPSVKLGILAVAATTWITIYITFSSTTSQTVTESFNQTTILAKLNSVQNVVATIPTSSNSCLVSTVDSPDMKKINTFADLNTALCTNSKVHDDSAGCPEKGIVTMNPGGRTGR